MVAHIDTVFPEGTDVKVKRAGDQLNAPGVGDNTRGVALVLSLIRAMKAAGFKTTSDILFVGNVGEEGEGDLRGVKFLLQKGKYKDRIKQFIAVDSGDQATITTGGVGSRRYRATFRGPGGHSYAAFGLVNPAYAMAGAIARFSRITVPQEPKTTFNIGAVSGGTSVNSIPFEVHMDVDMRSESCAELKKLDDQFLAVVREAVEEENKARSTREGKIVADPKLIGDRPCGETPRSAPIVQTTAAVVRAFGLAPAYRDEQHRREHADEPRHPGGHDRPRPRWPLPFPGRIHSRRAKSGPSGRTGSAGDHPQRRGDNGRLGESMRSGDQEKFFVF